MTYPVQNPDATEALLAFYDIKDRIAVEVDRIIQPSAIVDDGWARVTYLAYNLTVPASTAQADYPLHESTPYFAFALLGIEYRGTGNLTGDIRLKMSTLASFPGGVVEVGWNNTVLGGVVDPENVYSDDIIGIAHPTSPPSAIWEWRPPTTGIGETVRCRALLARIPRRMRIL